MKNQFTDTRRQFLRGLGWGGTSLFLLATDSTAAPAEEQGKETKKGAQEEEVSPTEDLMREHGLLNRVLLVYEESVRRLSTAPADVNPEVLSNAAGIIRDFIENYHEKLEEDYLFPRFEKAGKLVDLVRVLRQQHEAGRQVTRQILQLANAAAMKDPAARRQLSTAVHQFIRMYRPHESREDTVLFPALHGIVTPHEYATLGEEFEAKEHQLFGDEGFEKMVDKVAGLEKRLGIYDLAQFTPKA